ncbi:MAG: M20/M25/M40 family metallo-hydrolase, partial [Planctomycetota bacterium]
IARVGPEDAPTLLLDSHLDTVPPGAGWTREPHHVDREDGRVYGLGSNDAKASVAAMMATIAAFDPGRAKRRLVVALVADEETGGRGTEIVLPHLAARGERIDAAFVGEPTGLDLATAQKGLMILELVREGAPRHAAHPGEGNPIVDLARDLIALEAVDRGPEHPDLGRTRITPTVLAAGEAKNRVPAEARAVIDVRSVPGEGHEALVARLRDAVGGDLRIRSSRLEASFTPEDAAIVRAARRVRPEARVYGSPTMSDMVFLRGVPVVKCGPGRSERSHTADEFVLESEIIAGADFYARAARAFFEEIEG